MDETKTILSESDKMLAKTEFVCEATSYEVLTLWKVYSSEALDKTPLNCYEWIQHSLGYVITVGQFHGYAVNISCRWCSINNVLVMFYEACSMVVNYEMIGNWLKEYCHPRWDNGTRRAKTDAMNFHDVINHIDSVNKAKS
jgi:hypothetical protein